MVVYTVYSPLYCKNVFLIQIKECVESVPKKARGLVVWNLHLPGVITTVQHHFLVHLLALYSP